jgi:predicted nucleic acid-binding protein
MPAPRAPKPNDPVAIPHLTHTLDIYAYDAYVIDTAQRHGCPMLTLDQGLSQAARHVGVNVIEI